MGQSHSPHKSNTITRANIKAANRPDPETGLIMSLSQQHQFFGIVKVYYNNGVAKFVTNEKKMARFMRLRSK